MYIHPTFRATDRCLSVMEPLGGGNKIGSISNRINLTSMGLSSQTSVSYNTSTWPVISLDDQGKEQNCLHHDLSYSQILSRKPEAWFVRKLFLFMESQKHRKWSHDEIKNNIHNILFYFIIFFYWTKNRKLGQRGDTVGSREHEKKTPPICWMQHFIDFKWYYQTKK